MHEYMVRNGVPFPMQQLKIIKGKVPKSILGSYIKNGPGLFTIGEQVVSHWFQGDSGLLKVEFHEGKVFGMYKMAETPSYKLNIQQKNFKRPNLVYESIKGLFGFGNDMETRNSANTSVLRLPGSKEFYTLYEGGMPFAMDEKSMIERGFNDFGFIKNSFSAHPKIDPDNGDIYNVGFNTNTFDVYRISKDFKLIAKNTAKLRQIQTIHDCCLAGDFLVVFERPVKLDKWKLLKGQSFLKCLSVDYAYGKMIAYIFKKENLELVRRMELTSQEVFNMFHFTNGYVENNKLFVEYVKYPGVNAQKIMQITSYIPTIAKKGSQKKVFDSFSQLETLQVNLEDFSYKFHTQDFNCEFPVCQDHQVGKKWQYSYFIAGDKGKDLFTSDTLIKYDRINDKAYEKKYPGCCIVQPSLIRTKQGLFILVLISSTQRCTIEILKGQTLQTLAEIQLPEYVPYGFHGKWLEMDNKQLLKSGNM